MECNFLKTIKKLKKIGTLYYIFILFYSFNFKIELFLTTRTDSSYFFQVAQQELKRVKHLTAKQAARKKDNEMWEKNRMIRSG